MRRVLTVPGPVGPAGIGLDTVGRIVHGSASVPAGFPACARAAFGSGSSRREATVSGYPVVSVDRSAGAARGLLVRQGQSDR